VRARCSAIAIALAVISASAEAQLSGGASAILLGTVEKPAVEGRTLAEGYVTQPILMGSAQSRSRLLSIQAMIDLERFTLERGELNTGMYGEGYVDRRHPHTLLHEVVGTVGSRSFSVSAGKGFVSFGTDDPMSRPFVKYPVNHHLSQILERALLSAAGSSGPLTIEVSLFNGDEPESPTDHPDLDRFGDSYSARVTGHLRDFEAQASFAKVASPEQPRGGGLDAQKINTSLRYDKGGSYGLVEWARTREHDGNLTAFILYSFLAEGTLTRRAVAVSLRGEVTDRPEEERTLNVFRTPRPHSDLSILGRTRWESITANATRSFARGRISPFVEVAAQHPHSLVNNSAFDPAQFYGASWLWSFSAGVRLEVGMQHRRMGRYGAAVFHSMDHDMMDMEGM
jgi:hypothetical protein